MGTDVLLKSGEQPRLFNFGSFVGAPTYSVVAAATSLPIYKESPYSTFQVIVKGTGAVTVTGTVQCTNDDNTGRGHTAPGRNQPDYQVNTTSASAVVTSPQGDFDASLVGATVVGPGIPAGTTVSTFTNATSITLSANATATQAGSQMRFYDNAWNATALGTISVTTAPGADGFTTTAPWRYVRIVLSAITGTITGISANMGV